MSHTSHFRLHTALAILLLIGAGAVAQTHEGGLQIRRADTIDHALLILPSDARAIGFATLDGWRLSADEQDGFRVYRASKGDRDYIKRVALGTPNRRYAFNPKKARFEQLAQSVRVELSHQDLLEGIVRSAGGTGSKAYPMLGFALVHLSAEANPVQAAAAIQSMSGVLDARVMVRGPKRRPR